MAADTSTSSLDSFGPSFSEKEQDKKRLMAAEKMKSPSISSLATPNGSATKTDEANASVISPFASHDFAASSEFSIGSGISVTSTTRLPPSLTTKEASNSNPRVHYPSQRKVNQFDQSVTINQLQFSKMANLVGREEEIKLLDQALARAQDKCGKQLVLLSGYSGVGKSQLAKTLRRLLPTKNGGLYIEGKFDLPQRNSQPYAGLEIAVGSICAHLLKLRKENPESYPRLQKDLVGILGTDLAVLSRVFGILEEVFDNEERDETSIPATQNPTEIKHRLTYAFCRFMRVIVDSLRPVVLVLDDIQWADGPSLDLIDALLMDLIETAVPQKKGRERSRSSDTSGMLLVGIYRSNEVDKAHLLSSRMREWRKRATTEIRTEDSSTPRSCFQLQEIEVENLPFSAVHQYISGLLSMNKSQTLELAELCYHRTHGNIFFLIHFLRLLHCEELLWYNFAVLQWTWNLTEIEQKTVVSENVVALLLKKMKDLPKDETNLLRLASCLGGSFDLSTLRLVWKIRGSNSERNGISSVADNAATLDNMQVALDRLIRDGYFQESDRSKYRFAHDKVEEAASLLHETVDNTTSLQGKVGRALLSGLSSEELDSVIFVVVNLLNESGPPESREEQIELAALNRRAGNKAMSVSAFEAASTYMGKAIALLGETPFVEYYDLALDIFSSGAEAEASLGRVEMMEMYCQAVMQQASCPIEDKLRVYTTWLASLANKGQIKEAADQTLSLLRKFGIHFPKNRVFQSIQTFHNISKVKRGLKKGLLEKIVDLPVENDPTRIRLSHLMDRLTVYLFYMHDPLMPLVMFRNVQWTLNHGLNDVTPPALTSMGILFAGVLGDLQSGSKLAKTAVNLIPKVSPLVESRTLFTAYGFGLAWTQPLRDQIKPLLRGYEVGLCSGDVESSSWCIHFFYLHRYLTSFSLDLCIADVEIYMAQMKDLNQIVAYRSTIVNYQMFMNLAGRTESDPLSLSGEFCTEKEHTDWLRSDPFYLQHCRLWECYIHTLYGRHEDCARLAVKYGHDSAAKSHPGSFSVALFEVISKGISSAIAARLTKNREYRRNALVIHRRIKIWIDKGSPNVAHLDAFLDGQFSALAGKNFAAMKNFQVSIMIAARGGLLLDAALFSECFGEFLMEIGDVDEGKFRLQEAIKYYNEFGAHLKVERLETKFGNLWPKPSVVLATQQECS